MRSEVEAEVKKALALEKLGFLKDTLESIRLKQRELDNVISQRKGEGTEQDLALALAAELGEMLNEWNQFKFWHNDPQINVEAWKEESIDILHIAMSMMNTMLDKVDPDMPSVLANMLGLPTLDTDQVYNVAITGLYQSENTLEDYKELLCLLIGEPSGMQNMALWLSIAIFPFMDDFSELEKAYDKKFEINIQRAQDAQY